MKARIPELDAVRGVAILLVMFHNESSVFPSLHLERVFASGWMGVDLFFVLSGFLITGILLDTRRTEGYFGNFYARRCLRIWPLYFSLLAFMFAIVPLVRPSEAHTVFEKSSPWWSYPFFLQNFLIPVPTNAAGPLAVTWSLAIEEQFYLVWPWVVRFCSPAQMRRIAIVVICASPVLRLFLSSHGVNLYTNVFCRLDGLMAGAILALATRSDAFVPSRFVRPAWMALIVAIPTAVALDDANAKWIVFSLSAVGSAAFVFLALFSNHRWLHGALTNRFLVYTGTISYGLYLLHKIPFDMAKSVHLATYPWLAMPALLAVCYAMAAGSWNLLEKPFLRLKQWFEPTAAPLVPADGTLALALQTTNPG